MSERGKSSRRGKRWWAALQSRSQRTGTAGFVSAWLVHSLFMWRFCCAQCFWCLGCQTAYLGRSERL